jgi:hypothetical protein
LVKSFREKSAKTFCKITKILKIGVFFGAILRARDLKNFCHFFRIVTMLDLTLHSFVIVTKQFFSSWLDSTRSCNALNTGSSREVNSSDTNRL